MEFDVKGIPYDADVFQVQKAIEEVLHGPDLFDPEDPKTRGRVPNFKVRLNESEIGRLHNGSAILTLPTRKLGDRLSDWLREPKNGIRVLKRTLKFYRTNKVVNTGAKHNLEKSLYIGPEKEQERQKIVHALQESRLRIDKVQFGVWYKPPLAPPNSGRAFSVEYERDCSERSSGYLEISYDHKAIKIELGEPMTEEQSYNVVVKFSSIRKFGMGFDFGKAFIAFDLLTPPVLEEKNFNDRPREGIQRRRNKVRDRISALDDAHARVAPYAHHLRLVLSDSDDIYTFEQLCKMSQCEPHPVRLPMNIDISWRDFFSRRTLYSIEQWLKSMNWKNAFQIEALLRNGIMNTEDLRLRMHQPIEDVLKKYDVQASEILRQFTVIVSLRTPDETPLQCLKRVCIEREAVSPIAMAPGHFACHHVTFTPTRMILEGPYVTQSNRVIRRFQKHRPDLIENFVRVDFRDEDRISYRWDREVDGTWFLQQRVGKILKEGFDLGGKHFEFLGYSTSALREHAVWFVARFRDPEEGYVTAESIRQSLGDFSELTTKPSRYAARIAQAFTATDPSIVLKKGEWEEQPDLGLHTDGVGTISMDLADRMWEMKCAMSESLRGNRVKPSAYQIRFLGYKGVVVVDHRLTGIKMRLRKSQRKFPIHDVEEAEIEIARTFDFPNPVHLNRPVIMVLEDRGVSKDAFMDLQEKAKATVYTASDSLEKFRDLLKSSNLGSKYHLSFILEQLGKFDLDLTARNGKTPIGSAFLGRLLRYCINHVLRLMKHRARIPVPKSYQLVGVADEGQAYIQEGCDAKDVFTLDQGRIYVCVQESPDEEPKWLKGSCVISRSPVIHPGDVQRVHAVGKPPDDKLCFFKDLKNVVVLPAVGDRSLASCLAGGDLDGDTFDIYFSNPTLLPPIQKEPAEYPPGEIWELPNGREATVDDICDFVVEYINSDVVGLLSDRHLTIADQSKDGTFDERCMALAALCSKAVDYPKNGVAVNIDDMPHTYTSFKPDWHKAEESGPRDNDFYESDRALGFLYRGITLQKLDAPLDIPATQSSTLSDPISLAVAPVVQRTLNPRAQSPNCGYNPDVRAEEIGARFAASLYARYAREMRYIRSTHTLTDAPDVQLAEEEIVVGTILASCTQERWRTDRMYRMKLHVETLVKDIRNRILTDAAHADEERLKEGLKIAWDTWVWSQKNNDKEVIESFALVALGVVLDILKKLDAIPEVPDVAGL
ncbi:RdRP-domain-containing protein [Artomyces pyxidatus]|uniref:RdRP-domain-containing protein n=1 Tax=Artomyces pyxidatus TaxID=48021 RepID=A0ACB8T8L0_9AGAM|nr:RdRP-domain-containing protein [Artomyces pyxidatus]